MTRKQRRSRSWTVSSTPPAAAQAKEALVLELLRQARISNSSPLILYAKIQRLFIPPLA